MVKIPSSPSCCQCRVRKNGCSRTKPSCAICTARGYKCLYPKVPGGFKRLPNGEFVLIDLNDPNEISFGEYEKKQRMLRMEKKPVEDHNMSLPIPKEKVENVVEVEGNIVKGEDTFNKVNNYKVSNLMSSDESYRKSFNELIKLNHSKLLDYCLKLQDYLKYFENEIFINEKSSVFTSLKNVPIYNDLYDILYNNKYDKSISLEGNEVIIKKQIKELKKRLLFLTSELENKYNIKTVERENVTGSTHESKPDNATIENFDDDLFKDSMKFVLWGNEDRPTQLYCFKNLSNISTDINSLYEKYFKQFVDAEKNSKPESVASDNQFKKISWDDALPILETFSKYFLSTNIIPKKLFKIYDTASYKENSTKLMDLNIIDEKVGDKRKFDANNIDVFTTSKLENLLLLEYNIILIITLDLINANNMSQRILGETTYQSFKNFDSKYRLMIEQNVKQLFTWGMMFDKLENVDELKILYQLSLFLKQPLKFNWDLINCGQPELMEFQISIVKNQENFKGTKSYVRLNDYDNRLISQLLNNETLTSKKIDYILNELYNLQEFSQFENIDDYYMNLVDMMDDTNEMVKKVDIFLNYINYKLFWDYYKFENVMQYYDNFDEQVTEKQEMLSLAKSIMFSFTQLIELQSLQNIEMSICLMNDKIVEVYETIISILYSINKVDSKLIQEILTNVKTFLILNESNSSISLTSKLGAELLALLNVYIYDLKSKNEVIDDDKSEYKGILRDMNKILHEALQQPVEGKINEELKKDLETIDEQTYRNISALLDG